MPKKSAQPTRYAWGHRNLTIEEWVLEPDVWLRGIDEDMLRARLEGPQPWSVEHSLLRAGVDGEPELRAEALVPKAEGRSAAARELNTVRKALLRLVALGGFVPLKDYHIAAALVYRHVLPPPPAPPQPATEVAWHTFEVKEMSPIKGTRTRQRYWGLVEGGKDNLGDTIRARPSSLVIDTTGPRLLRVSGPTSLDAEAFPVGTRRTIITSQRFVASVPAPEGEPT